MTKRAIPRISLLRYEPETGRLYWRSRPVSMFPDERASKSWNTRYADKEAFTAKDEYGYRTGTILGVRYLAHRVIWAMIYGDWPPDEIDHINGVRDDNRLTNLRAVSSSENSKNSSLRLDNISGVGGVYWHKPARKWRARIGVSNRDVNLGLFTDFNAAVAARRAAEAKHGYHENHGRASGKR